MLNSMGLGAQFVSALTLCLVAGKFKPHWQVKLWRGLRRRAVQKEKFYYLKCGAWLRMNPQDNSM